jgi:hypothetical protein
MKNYSYSHGLLADTPFPFLPVWHYKAGITALTSERYTGAGEISERYSFKQLFIGACALRLLRYLKRLPRALRKNKSQYFIITRPLRISNEFSRLAGVVERSVLPADVFEMKIAASREDVSYPAGRMPL